MKEEGHHSYIAMSIQDYKEGLGNFEHKMPDVAKKYMQFTQACFAPGELDQKTKHLIALGISIYSQDEYCIMYHTQEAFHTGASEQEILEVIGVSAAFGGGAAISQGVTLVQECLDEFSDQQNRH